jgi:hypothetical protein
MFLETNAPQHGMWRLTISRGDAHSRSVVENASARCESFLRTFVRVSGTPPLNKSGLDTVTHGSSCEHHHLGCASSGLLDTSLGCFIVFGFSILSSSRKLSPSSSGEFISVWARRSRNRVMQCHAPRLLVRLRSTPIEAELRHRAVARPARACMQGGWCLTVIPCVGSRGARSSRRSGTEILSRVESPSM